MKILPIFLQGLHALSFNKFKITTCSNGSTSEGQFEISFQGQCGKLQTKSVSIESQMTEVDFNPVRIEKLHRIIVEWKGKEPVCLKDLIVQSSVSKIQLLENFPRDQKLERQAWFSRVDTDYLCLNLFILLPSQNLSQKSRSDG